MFYLVKRGRGRLAPLLLLLMVLLLPGCSSGQPDQAGGGPQPPAGTPAAQTLRPGDEAAPLPGAAEGTAVPSAPAEGTAAPASPAAAATQPSAGASEPAKPASPGAAATQPSAGASEPAKSPASPGAAATQPSAGASEPAKPASPSAATTQPSAGASKPAKSPAATPKPPTPAPAAAATPKPDNVVTLSITGDEEHGVILAAAQYEIKKGESVLDLLKRITRAQKIQMEFQGSKAFAYVEGIDNLYEGDHGAESGWMYKVNGEFPSKAAGSWIVEPGDTIEWLYTLDLGKDLGAKAP
ncbi:DUF4430 domain-containing protein [Paenibacillus sp. FSL R7-0210]|uniref:DUF4430 domain-containing protein n=1 Tax=Paenibacillus sp. FSL R7-0210 TaxID=2921676 RepID=UPI0030F77061